MPRVETITREYKGHRYDIELYWIDVDHRHGERLARTRILIDGVSINRTDARLDAYDDDPDLAARVYIDRLHPDVDPLASE